MTGGHYYSADTLHSRILKPIPKKGWAFFIIAFKKGTYYLYKYKKQTDTYCL